MKRIYVAGPITKGDQFLNVANAIEAANALLLAGLEPFVPHLTFQWHMRFPVAYERWMQYDFAWLDVCDALLRIPGESAGADREVARATERGIPVFYSVRALLDAEATR